jgi:hypothetical protein
MNGNRLFPAVLIEDEKIIKLNALFLRKGD